MKRPIQASPAPAKFELQAPFSPQGDQPSAILKLNQGLEDGLAYQTLLGITGSGKTFTIANVIQKQNRPCLVIAPNKTLAAQLYAEFKDFFPNNLVKYFVSYYDYYQPEAYVPSTDTYIEKDSAINEEIDKMRHAATRAVLERRDTIIVASVSCIYGLGAPEDYFAMLLCVERGQQLEREQVISKLVHMQYTRSDLEFKRGNFRLRGDVLDILPSDDDIRAVRLVFFGDQLEDIREIDALSGTTYRKMQSATVYPVSHYVTDREKVLAARKTIRAELNDYLPRLRNQGKFFEAQRLEQRTLYDLELLKEIGFCSGIENYSRHLTGRAEGEPPATLIDYFPDDFLLVVDESHVTCSQLGAMYRGDRSRKQTLVDYGFRLPSALDNRPLKGEEFWQRVNQTIFVSATPGNYELELSQDQLIEQVNRPTGLLDPQVIIRPALNQVDDLISEIHNVVAAGDRVLVTVLTKKMAEDLAEYLRELNIKARYLHSDIQTIERVEILRGLRKGEFDVLIGINLLREGLDLAEVALVAILDADKEGFLRSERSLIQTIGRTARNISGRAILYADKETGSIKAAVAETERRRKIQAEYNTKNNITPRTASRAIAASLVEYDDMLAVSCGDAVFEIPTSELEQRKLIGQLRTDMFQAAEKREFERAASLRDAIKAMEERLLFLTGQDSDSTS